MAKRAKTDSEKQNRVVTTTWISQENVKNLKEIASKEHRTLSQQVAHAIEEWLKYRHEIDDLRVTTEQIEKN